MFFEGCITQDIYSAEDFCKIDNFCRFFGLKDFLRYNSSKTMWADPHMAMRIRVKVSKFVHIWAKNGSKSLPCHESVAAVWCPEGVGHFLFWRRDQPWWPLLLPKSCVQECQGRVFWKHFSKFMARPLVAKAVKKASRWRRCVCLSGEPTRESSI